MRCFLFLLLIFALWLPGIGTAQVPPAPAQAIVPFSELASQAAETQARLLKIDAEMKDSSTLWSIKSGLPILTLRINSRESEDTQLFSGRLETDVLGEIALQWKALETPLKDWNSQLSLMSKHLSETRATLHQEEARWKATSEASSVSDLSKTLQDEAILTASRVADTQAQLEKRSKDVVDLQNQVALQLNRIKGSQEHIELARSRQVKQVFERDSAAIYDQATVSEFRSALVSGLPELGLSLSLSLISSFQQQAGAMAVPLVSFLILYMGLTRLAQWAQDFEDKNLEAAMVVLKNPAATALLLSLVVSRGGLDASTPRIVLACLGLCTLAPAVLLLNGILGSRLRPLLYALIGFCVVDQVRFVATPLPVLVRSLLLLECLGALAFCLWLRRQESPLGQYGWLRRVAAALFFISLISNIFGYWGLASVLCNTLLRGAYTAVLLIGCLQVLNALLVVGLQLRPLILLRAVSQHRGMWRRELLRIAKCVALWAWFVSVLDNLSLTATFFQSVSAVLTASLSIGTLQLTLGRTITACLLVWLSLKVSKFARFVLNEDVFPNLKVSRGIPYGVASGVHYLSITLGILLALSALGIDTTHFTMVAGALSVGLGFGLQNVVNNFVSGVILLVERPVNVGDTVKLGEFQGELKRIGLRSSILVVGDGSQVIIPNSELINQRVVNWSGCGDTRRLTLTVSIPIEASVSDARSVLERTASENPALLQEPAPEVLVLGVKGSNIDLQLLSWVGDYRTLQAVKSQLIVELSDKLGKLGIVLTSSV